MLVLSEQGAKLSGLVPKDKGTNGMWTLHDHMSNRLCSKSERLAGGAVYEGSSRCNQTSGTIGGGGNHVGIQCIMLRAAVR